MNILMIHNRYQSNNIGGEDIVFDNELSSVRRMFGKHNVFFLDVSNDRINRFLLIFTVWHSIKYYYTVKRIVKTNNIQIVHVHNYFPLITPSVFKAAKLSGAKVVHTLHNYRMWCIAGTFYQNGHGICEKCLGKKLPLSGIINKCYRHSRVQSIVATLAFAYYRRSKAYSYVDYFFALTKFQMHKLNDIGIHRDKIIYKPNSLTSHVSSNNKRSGYIFVGRLEESKGITVLLDSWLNLDTKYKLCVVGDGYLRNYLIDKYASRNITFTGILDRDETLHRISKSKYLIQPSIWYETFGLTMLEAMSVGVPVIGFNIGTRQEFIIDGYNGFICDKDKLIDVIKKSFSYSNYDALSNNAAMFASTYSHERISAMQEGLYRNMPGVAC